MTYFLIISCVLCGWAMLRVMGSERAYLVKELERNLRREARRAPVAADPPAAADSPPDKAAPATKGKN